MFDLPTGKCRKSLSTNSIPDAGKVSRLLKLVNNDESMHTEDNKGTNEPRHEKTNVLHIRKQRRRSASR